MLLSQSYQSPARITDLPNINSKVASQLAKIGLRTADDFLNTDPYQVFDGLLKKVDPDLKKKDLAVIVGAYKGCHWNNVLNESLREYRLRRPKHVWKG